jgi:hypothetical protein
MARSAVVRIEARTDEAREQIGRMQADLEELEVEAVEAGGGFERLSQNARQELTDLRGQARRTSTSMSRVGTSAQSTASNLGFELTQAAQDAQFGIAGVANQIPLLSEQFTRLQSQTGSTTGALSTMLQTFKGPTGILALGTLGLQALPQITEFFSGIGDSAKKASEEVDQLKSATDTLIEGFAEELPSFEITDRAQAQELQQGLEQSIQSREQVLEDLREALGATGAEQAQLSRGAARFSGLSDAAIQDLINRQQSQLNQERALEQVLSEKLREREQAVQQQDLLNAATEQGIQLAEEEAEGRERQEQAMNGLAVSAKQTAKNMQVVERTLNSMDQMPMQRRISAFGAGFQAPTLGGTMLNQGQSQGELMLQAARDAGFISSFQDFSDVFRGGGGGGQTGQPEGLEAISMSLEEIQREFGVSEDKARQFKRTANQQLGSVVNAAGQLGQALVRAFSKGEKSAQSIAATLLQGVGGVLSVIPGAGQIAGPVLGQLGGLISAFDQGGVVNTPLQVVGESGPELAALPQGTRVSTARETERMLSQQQVNVNVTGEIRRLRSRELGLILREDETRRNQFGYS